ncbi:MAG: LuxR C-terminal-related transcriptional regulator [Tepidisphaeraceae bacterium]
MTADEQRRVLVEFVRSVAPSGTVRPPAGSRRPSQSPDVARRLETLSPPLRQTLEALLAGQSEKQIAHATGRSQHTIHDHAKKLHRHFRVSSRGELLALFVQRPG